MYFKSSINSIDNRDELGSNDYASTKVLIGLVLQSIASTMSYF